MNERVSKARKKQIEHHNKSTNIVSHRFSVGDFVLVRITHGREHKLSFRWKGPRRITRAIGDTVYEVENLLSGQLETVHASRMILYRDDLNGKELSESLKKQLQHVESKYEVIDKFLDIAEGDDGIFVHVQCLGQPDKVDWTWQPLLELYEDVPEKLEIFLRESRRKIAKEAIRQLGI